MGILMEATNVTVGHCNQLFNMGSPSELYETVHTIAINTRETDYGSIVQHVPITFKKYKNPEHINNYAYPQSMVTSLNQEAALAQRVSVIENPSSSTTKSFSISPVKEPEKQRETCVSTVRPPPKKKWIKEYLEEEPQPQPPVAVRVLTTTSTNNVIPPLPTSAAPPASVLLLDYVHEHSRPRTTSISHGLPQVPSPPSVSSSGSSGSGSAPRAGTREVHNKLEKNRRAHLKECFELLKRQLPNTTDDKKTSNLSILGSAIRFIQVLRRKEREGEHEMERLAREKIAAQQRLANLKREVAAAAITNRIPDVVHKDGDENINGKVMGIPISITSSALEPASSISTSPPRTLNLSTKLRTRPIQTTPTTSQVVRTTYGARHNTLTLTTLAPAEPSVHNGENGVTNTLSTLVHPAQIHLPISQVMGSGGLVVGGALQLVSTSSGLRVVQSPIHTNGVAASENNRISNENTVVTSLQTSSGQPVNLPNGLTNGLNGLQNGLNGLQNGLPNGLPNGVQNGVVSVNGLPLVVSQPAAHFIHTHTLAHKMVETQVVKGTMPLTVSAQYLSATTIMKPVVVVSSAPPT